ncbi:unnamed protein product [Callosobruchus maculatus]|uniref:Uncharacterized protein n=1 Tax=Callosobruchus maculatus TaxID=64391 RepID=A0A653CRK4_CALMS|nr:unnamed protein product [Callosobruchus maculatus]
MYYEHLECDSSSDFRSDDNVQDKDYIQSDRETDESSSDGGQDNYLSVSSKENNDRVRKRGSLPTPDKAPSRNQSKH